MSEKRKTYEEVLEQVRPLVDHFYWKQFVHYARTGEMSGRLLVYLSNDSNAQKASEILDTTAMQKLELLAMDTPPTEK